MNDINADPNNSADKKQNSNLGTPNLIKAAVLGVIAGGAAVAIANKQNRDKLQKVMQKTEKTIQSKINEVQKKADQIKENNKKQLAGEIGKVQKKLLNKSK
jgi:hypothetical protein